MTKQQMFTIYDEKAKAYITPFFQPNEAVAVRSFRTMVNDKTHQFGQHPSDYTLFVIGDFDIATGEFDKFEAKRSVGNGTEFVNRHNEE
jgi:hypothetical protein